jgi:tetratricopeptide (TPR) repeat protein
MKNCLIRMPVFGLLRTALWAGLGIVCLASAPAMVAGQDPVGVCKDSRGCTPDSGSGSGGSSGAGNAGGGAVGWLGCKLFGGRGCPEKADKHQAAAYELNEKGLEAYKKGDWANAASFFEQALRNSPDDPVIKQNVANARAWLANDEAKEKAEREEAEAKRKDKAAADNMQQSIQNFAKTLNATPSSGGLDFDGGGSANPANGGSKSDGLDFTSGDPGVVDARIVPSGLPKAMDEAIAGAYKDAPAGVIDRVRKGFQAVMERDWKVARAWFEDALNRDPNNAGLKRLVALTDSPQPSNRQITPSDKPFTNEAIPPNADKRTYAETSMKVHSQEEWRKFLFPDEAPVLTKLPDGRRVYLQIPTDSDMEFLFDTSAPAPKPNPTYRIDKAGNPVAVPEDYDGEAPMYIKGKDGKLLEVPKRSDRNYLFPGTTPAATPKPAFPPEPKEKKL